MVLSVSSAQAAAVSTAAPSKLSGYEAALRGATPAHTAMSSSAPSGNISNNVEFVANIPALVSAISIAFIGNDMFVSTVHGVYAYDISDVANPQLLGAIPMYIWENEHMTADAGRHLIFVSRDPRGFTTPLTSGGTFPYGAIHIIDVSNPTTMHQVGFFTLPVGHTSTCIGDCRYIWTGGPAAGTALPADWGGRPIRATDVSDPLHPVDCGKWLDTGANDGKTDYAHSIDIDDNGVVWVSGRGHVRGFWTGGPHVNPVDRKVETASPCDPIPYAGGGTNEGNRAEAIIHNSWHDPSASVDGRSGDVLYATEEDTTTDCKLAGRFLTYDIGGSYHGEGFANTDKTHFRLAKLDQWTPQGQPGSTGCDSAHWFTERGQTHLIAEAFYSQGTRFLDVSDPRHIRQAGYFNAGGDTWAAYWRPDNIVGHHNRPRAQRQRHCRTPRSRRLRASGRRCSQLCWQPY